MKKAEEQQQTTLQIAHTMIESKLKNTSAIQLKLLILIADRIQTEHKKEAFEIDNLDKIYNINFDINHLRREFNVSNFSNIENSFRELQRQEISYKKVDEEGIWTCYENFFGKTEFLEDRKVRVKITGSILQFLALLNNKGYTKVIKEIVLSLKSKYSIKLLELSSKIQQQDTKKREYEIKEFCEMLDFNLEQARGLSKLKTMLEKAKDELNSKSKISFDYELKTRKWTNKVGKPSYTHIEIMSKSNDVQPLLF